MKIGLIGAQNSHSRHFCEVINKNKKFEDATIAYIYGGDDPEECKRLCDDFGIAECLSEAEVIEKSDAVAVTYRKGSIHRAPVIAALNAGKPVFNDKPFTTDLNEAKEIAASAKKLNVPITGGSSLKGLPGLLKIKNSITSGSTTVISFAADPNSEYDGYWFYGIHAAEVCLTLCGLDFVSVQSFKNANMVITNVVYPDKLCVLATAPQSNKLMVSVSNDGKTACYDVPMDYSDMGPEEFVNMAKTGTAPRDYEFYIKSVELLGKII
jgi:hypothetical protein